MGATDGTDQSSESARLAVPEMAPKNATSTKSSGIHHAPLSSGTYAAHMLLIPSGIQQ